MVVHGRLCVVVRAWPFVVVRLLDGPVIRCRDNFFPALNIFPAIRHNSQSCDFRRGFRDKWWTLRESYIAAVHTHSRIFVCRSAINITFCE